MGGSAAGKATKERIPPGLAAWIAVRRRLHLSHAHVQMARELGFDPERLPKLASVRDQPWKMPLGEYIEHLYQKKFGRDQPEVILTIEQMVERKAEMKRRRKEKRLAERADPRLPGV